MMFLKHTLFDFNLSNLHFIWPSLSCTFIYFEERRKIIVCAKFESIEYIQNSLFWDVVVTPNY